MEPAALPRDKIKRYEALFQQLGVDLGSSNASGSERPGNTVAPDHAIVEEAVQVPTPQSTATEQEQPATNWQLIHGRGRAKVVEKSV
ncbi:MAG: hypothetical protein Q9218_002599 [Villophora microphyllina]